MLIEKSMHPQWLSNSYLVADGPGGHAILIDSGGPMEPLLERIEALRLRLTHLLCTHHHYDHVANNGEYRRLFDCTICGHPAEKELFDGDLDALLEDGQTLQTGSLEVRVLHIPGHTMGQLAFVVNDHAVFTGDTLFRGSVGGTVAPGHGTFQELRSSILDVLMKLPPDSPVYPGHTEATTISREWEENPFIRLWRGLDEPSGMDCVVMGQPAKVLLEAPDYDEGTKCQVEFLDGSGIAIVGGSRVTVHRGW